jgi:hypothetical protein
MEDDQISLKCPACGQNHTYELIVDRSFVLGLEVPGSQVHTPRMRTFTRFFICPVTSSQFQATLRMQDTQATAIESLDVGTVLPATQGGAPLHE